MSRVSENSNSASVNYSINKAKTKLEDLQLKGANLRRMVKPSDDPMGNIELMQIRANKLDIDQFKRNASMAMTSLEYTDNSLKELIDILNKAKEIAIGQSSDFYNAEVRKSVSKEVGQLRKQVLGISNRRLGSRYIFSGFKTLDRPFTNDGHYYGDSGISYLEILKDFFIPVNLPGDKVFFLGDSQMLSDDPLKGVKDLHFNKEEHLQDQSKLRQPINNSSNSSPTLSEFKTDSNSQEISINSKSHNLFNVLRALENSLLTNNPDFIQDLLEEIDHFMDQTIALRASVGSTMNTLANSEITLGETDLFMAARKTKIEDADIAELYTDLQKQGQLLQASYKTSSRLINENLLDFLK